MDDQEKPRIEVIAPTLTRILLTPERIEAIKNAIQILEKHMEEYGTTYQEGNVAILKEMIYGA